MKSTNKRFVILLERNKINIVKFSSVLFAFFFIMSCQWGPKERELVIPSIHDVTSAEETGLFFDLHEVKILEVKPTDKYDFLKVSEGGRIFWIAARHGNFLRDSLYYYREALLKKDFESKQLNHVFDSIYLVTKLVPNQHFKDSAETLNTVNHK